jgi:hypothetical protein
MPQVDVVERGPGHGRGPDRQAGAVQRGQDGGQCGGTIVGAVFIEFVPNLADKVSKAAPGAVYGVILIAMLFLMPMGAGGFLSSQWRKWIGGRGRQADAAEPMLAAREKAATR